MNALPHDTTERARKNESLILQRLLSVGQSNVAAELSVSESTVSRLKEGNIGTLASMLAVLGLKVVPVAMKCYRPEDIQPLIELARQRMTELRTADQLEWEDERG